MYDVDLSHVTNNSGDRLILRLKDRQSGDTRSINLSDGVRQTLPETAFPSAASTTVAWIDKVNRQGNVTPITLRVRLDALKQVSAVERWMRQPNATTTAAEATSMATKMHMWEVFVDEEWENRLVRIYNDALKRLQRLPKLRDDSRISSLCRAYWELFEVTDSLPGNVVSGLNALNDIHNAVSVHPLRNARQIRHITENESGPPVSPLAADLKLLMSKSLGCSAATTTSKIIRGYISSITEGRETAVREIEAVKRSGRERLLSLYSDMGALTYGFPHPSLEDSEVEIHWQADDVAGTSPFTILQSANIPFLRRYLARILFYALAQPQLHFHFHLIATESESTEFITEAETLLVELHRFSGRNPSLPRISWSSSDLPAYAGNPVTYFACARYLVAEQVMDRFDRPVWIQDVDLYPTASILTAKSRLSEFDVALPGSGGVSTLAPWRRYIANNVFLADSEGGRLFARAAAQYIRGFLPETDSWMLDQNALDWAVEQVSSDAVIGDMRQLDIHLTQSAMNGPIES
ncbi:hypothetical protein IWX75_003200 [Arthrobacter sp. CAN_A6]|uniref:hypothetical protein n=1 Tax=Arthrobacter sp. CAN_A6 TaxID=2787721 RepID=UPI0018CBA9BF